MKTLVPYIKKKNRISYCILQITFTLQKRNSIMLSILIKYELLRIFYDAVYIVNTMQYTSFYHTIKWMFFFVCLINHKVVNSKQKSWMRLDYDANSIHSYRFIEEYNTWNFVYRYLCFITLHRTWQYKHYTNYIEYCIHLLYGGRNFLFSFSVLLVNIQYKCCVFWM